MSKQLPWYKRDVDAWRGGTRSMSMELRGFYSECLDAMWDLQGAIPAEPEKLAIMLCCNPRTVRKLLPQLVALGKLVRTNDGYLNARMADEIEAAGSKPIPREFDVNSNGIGAEFEPNVAKNPMFSTRVLEKEEEEGEEETPPIRPTNMASSPPARATALQSKFEKGRVQITADLATEIAIEYPKARLPEVLTAAAAKLAPMRRLSPDGIDAIVLECARWNHRDNDRPMARGRPYGKCSQEFVDLYNSMKAAAQ